MKKIYFPIIFFLLTLSCLAQNKKPDIKSNQNVNDARVESILSQMTLDEKLAYIGGLDNFYIMPIARLGLPQIKMSDGPVGVRTWGQTTAYPAGIASAATFDTALINQLGQALGKDARARGVHILLAPGVNIYRAPMCGRNFEYFGEDPFLSAQMATAYINGVQSKNVVATVKHYAGNNQEWDRYDVSSNIDERTLNEIYFPAFKAAITKAHAGCIMTAYNLLNGTWCSQNNFLINQTLKTAWGFKGFAMSDWGATHDGVAAVNAGLDLEMPSGANMNAANLNPAINSGIVQSSAIDDKVRRILGVLVRFGFLDNPQTITTIPLDNPDNANISYQIACEGTVLLKNDSSFLPLKRSAIKNIAVIGPNANSYITGGGSSYTDPFHSVSVFAGLQNVAGSGIQVNYDMGLPNDASVFSSSVFYPYSNTTYVGLMGEYYPNQNLQGAPSAVKLDPLVNFDWGAGSPTITNFPVDHFSIRWTGFILPQKSSNYNFIVRGDDGYRLWINDTLLIDNWHDEAATSTTKSKHLEAGKFYTVKLEYYENAGDASIGFGWYEAKILTDNARNIITNADAVVVCVGFNSSTESEGSDRSFTLLNNQDSMINAVAQLNKNTIVVLNAGGNVYMQNWLKSAKALIHAWYPGQEGGTAIAKIIFGDVNPSGKLPASFEKKWADNPVYKNYYDTTGTKQVNYSEGLYVGYRYYDSKNVEPQFPFGFGLSYTTFEYSNLQTSAAQTTGAKNMTVTFDIKNTGAYDGFETPQLYIHQNASELNRPTKELKAFAKIFIKAGETKTVTLQYDSTAVEYYKPYKKAFDYDAGQFTILVGASSRDIRLTANYQIVSPDATQPEIVRYVPLKNGSSTTPTYISLTFNKNVYCLPNKNLYLKKYITDETVFVKSLNNYEGMGTTLIGFLCLANLEINSKYYVIVDTATVKDNFGNTFTGLTSKDDWTFTCTSLNGVSKIENDSKGFELFPNPTNGSFTIRFANTLNINNKITITNLLGETVYSRNLKSTESEFTLNQNFASGMYIVQLFCNNISYQKQLNIYK